MLAIIRRALHSPCKRKDELLFEGVVTYFHHIISWLIHCLPGGIHLPGHFAIHWSEVVMRKDLPDKWGKQNWGMRIDEYNVQVKYLSRADCKMHQFTKWHTDITEDASWHPDLWQSGDGRKVFRQIILKKKLYDRIRGEVRKTQSERHECGLTPLFQFPAVSISNADDFSCPLFCL